MSEDRVNEDRVTLTIDGQEVSVPKGTTIIEAAKTIGVNVPHYCYHPGLSSPAQCRLCLVEVEGAPKLMPSCVTSVQDGQVVHTESESATAMRQGVLEFYLANHPLDCPICDQSGECKLQDYVFAEGRAHGRSREPKRVFGRDDFGGDVLFYGDRCVMCTRCVRFMEEVAQDPVLTVVERGNRSIIDTFFEQSLDDSPYHGNIVDICPVGALVSKDFLHKARAWDLEHTPSICTGCSQGCNIELHVRDNRVHRLKPRENPEVNGHWMCDYGRQHYEWMNRPDRLETPAAGRSDARIPTDWKAALEDVAGRLAGAKEDGSGIRAVASPHSSNEDLSAIRSLVDLLGGGEIVFRSARAEDEEPLPGFPQLVRRRELTPNRTGAEALGMTRVGDDDGRGGLESVASHDGVVLVVGDELDDQDASFGANAGVFVYLGAHPSEAAAGADAVLPSATYAEQDGHFTNEAGRIQSFRAALRAPGAAHPAWRILGYLTAVIQGEDPPEGSELAFALGSDRHPRELGMTPATVGFGRA